MENYAASNMVNEPGYESVAKALEAIRNGQFYKAMDLITELKRNKQQTARAAILKMLCGYKVSSTSELLISNSKSVMKLQKIAEDSEWKTVREELSEYVDDIIEYCAIAIEISPDTDRFRNVRPTQNLSAFAKMDAEEEYNMERMRATGESDKCQDTTAIENLVSDYEAMRENEYYVNGVWIPNPDCQGVVSKNINKDMSDLLISTEGGGMRADGFTSKLFGRKKKESSEEKSFLGASEELLSKSSEPKSALGKALQDIQYQGRNEAELKARQVDLIKRIDQLEQQIFAM